MVIVVLAYVSTPTHALVCVSSWEVWGIVRSSQIPADAMRDSVSFYYTGTVLKADILTSDAHMVLG